MTPLYNISLLPSEIQGFTETPGISNNALNYSLGLALMIMNKVRGEVKG
ncbi:MAG: hypothetical protein ACI8X3_001446 [Saprospiraceae bacterium]|jgi:hypothetical protein